MDSVQSNTASKRTKRNFVTMSGALQPKDFNPELLSSQEPVKNTGDNEYTTIDIKYGGKEFKCITPYPGVFCNAIGEAPKNPHKLTQGFSLETPEQVKMHEEASKIIFGFIVKHRNHPNMPAFCKNMDSVEKIMSAKDLGTTVKTLIHYPEKRDDKGNGTGKPDPDATPKCYPRLIRSGVNHPETPSKIWTTYYSAAILSGKVDAMIKAGKAKEDDYKFDPLELFKRKACYKAMPCYSINDIYLAPGNIIIRCSVSEVYIIKFEEKESQARKELRGQLAMAGIEIEGPGALPEAPEDGEEPKNTVEVDPPSGGDEGFTVTVTE